MSKAFIIIILTVLCFSCNGKIQLENDKLLAKYFNDSEIKDLEVIINLFEKEVSKNCKDSITTCIKMFLKNARLSYMKDDFGFTEEFNGASIEDKISKSTFNKIWDYALNIDRNNRQDSTLVLIVKNESNYIEFLRELGEIKPYLNEYLKVGTSIDVFINAGSMNYIYKNYELFNLIDERDKLVLAIHFLTINDHLKIIQYHR